MFTHIHVFTEVFHLLLMWRLHSTLRILCPTPTVFPLFPQRIKPSLSSLSLTLSVIEAPSLFLPPCLFCFVTYLHTVDFCYVASTDVLCYVSSPPVLQRLPTVDRDKKKNVTCKHRGQRRLLLDLMCQSVNHRCRITAHPFYCSILANPSVTLTAHSMNVFHFHLLQVWSLLSTNL